MAFNIKKRGKITYFYEGDAPVLSNLVVEEQADGDPSSFGSFLLVMCSECFHNQLISCWLRCSRFFPVRHPV